MANNTLLNLLKKGKKAWNQWRSENPDAEIDLTNTDLKGANLMGFNLSYGLLAESNFSGANLAEANLENSNLWYANFENANFKAANLRGASCYHTNFKGANFKHANLEYAMVGHADFTNANMEGANQLGMHLGAPKKKTVKKAAPKKAEKSKKITATKKGSGGASKKVAKAGVKKAAAKKVAKAAPKKAAAKKSSTVVPKKAFAKKAVKAAAKKVATKKGSGGASKKVAKAGVKKAAAKKVAKAAPKKAAVKKSSTVVPKKAVAKKGSGIRSSRKEVMETDLVKCSVFAPPAAVKGSTIMVQVFAHLKGQEKAIMKRAKKYDSSAEERGEKNVDREVERGSKLTFNLVMKGLKIDDPIQYLIWRGDPESVQFGVSIPKKHPNDEVVGAVYFSQNNVPIGHIKFQLRIDKSIRNLNNADLRSTQQGKYHHYENVFISYASVDRSEVVKYVKMFQYFNTKFFMDLLSLDPGDRWEKKLYEKIDEADAFFLFWSKAAKNSEWVMKEVNYALKRATGKADSSPEILPVIIEQPAPLPPNELKEIHFNDKLNYY